MLERSNLVMRGKSEQTKRRQQTDILLKRAMKGNRQAKVKLYKEFGIRVYSSEEVERYVKERMAQEYPSERKNTTNGPDLLTGKNGPGGLSKKGRGQSGNTSLSFRRKLKQKTRKVARKNQA